MKKRAVDLDIAELARLGREAAEKAAAAARARGLSSFGAAEVAGPGGPELRFVTVDPSGEITVGDRVPGIDPTGSRKRNDTFEAKPSRYRREIARG